MKKLVSPDFEPPNRRNFPESKDGKGGRLTCSLPGDGSVEDQRDILLVKEGEFPLPISLRPEFDRFQKAFLAGRGDKTRKQKDFVNLIFEGGAAVRDFPNVSVAVHKFGPVPVFVVPGEVYQTNWNDKTIEVNIAIHPRSRTPIFQSELGYSNNAISFICSLQHHMHRTMVNYFGDVAALFKDIEEISDHRKALEVCKMIEVKVGESIKSKLRHLVPSHKDHQKRKSKRNRNEWKDYIRDPKSLNEDRVLACRVYEENSTVIQLTQFVRLIVLFLVNETYKHLGLSYHSARYLAEIKLLKERISDMHNQGFEEFLLEAHQDAKFLARTLDAYIHDDFEYLQKQQLTVLPTWCIRLINYFRFLQCLKVWEVPAHVPRIFLSRPHNSDVSKKIVEQFQNWAAVAMKGAEQETEFRVLTVEDARNRLPIQEAIKSGIWQSDATICLFVRNRLDFNWLVKEAEHTLLLGKEVHFLIEDGVKIQAIENSISKEIKPSEDLFFKFDLEEALRLEDSNLSPLVPTTRAPVGRARRLLEYFRSRPYTKFRHSTEKLHELIESRLIDLSLKLREARHDSILIGYLRQFSERIRTVIAYIGNQVPYPISENMNNLAKDLHAKFPVTFATTKSALSAMEDALEQTSKRRIHLPHLINQATEICILTKPLPHCYSSKLEDILLLLRPDLARNEIEDWRKKLLKQIDY